jgi:hypothetical protein
MCGRPHDNALLRPNVYTAGETSRQARHLGMAHPSTSPAWRALLTADPPCLGDLGGPPTLRRLGSFEVPEGCPRPPATVESRRSCGSHPQIAFPLDCIRKMAPSRRFPQRTSGLPTPELHAPLSQGSLSGASNACPGWSAAPGCPSSCIAAPFRLALYIHAQYTCANRKAGGGGLLTLVCMMCRAV